MTQRSYLLAFYSCISFLLFFQSRWAVTKGYGFDESCYLEHFHRFLFEPVWTCYSRDHLKGAALTWLPIGIFVKIFTHLFHQPFTDWALPIIGLTSFGQWVASLFILDKTFCLLAKSNGMKGHWPPFWSVVVLFSVPVTNYAFRSTYFSHAAELLLVCLTFYSISSGKVIWALVWASFLGITRLNDIFILGPIFAFVQPHFFNSSLSKNSKRLLIGASLVASVVCLTLFLRIAFFTGYNGFFLSHVLKAVQWKGVHKAFFEHTQGLIWRQFAWLLAFVFLTLRLPKLSNIGRSIWLWQLGLISLYVSMTVFWGFGEERYLIASYVALYWFILSIWSEIPRTLQKTFLFLVPFSAAWNLWIFSVWIAPVLRFWVEKTGDKTSSSLVATINLLFYPKEVLKAVVGLSPIGFTFFSWLKEKPAFSSYSHFANYGLIGPELWVMTAACIGAVVCLVLLTWGLFGSRKCGNFAENERT